MTFRLQARHVFLTYSRCTLDKPYVFSEINSRFPVVKAIVCRELHEDGTPHVHAIFQFTDKLNIRDSRAFDLGDYHPKVEPVRSWKRARRYVEKHGDFDLFPSDDDHSDEDTRSTAETHAGAYDVARKSETREKFFVWALRVKLSYAWASTIWNDVHGGRAPTLTSEPDLDGRTLLPMLRLIIFDPSDRRAVVLQGPTGIGKTTWALKNIPKPALLVTHIDDLKTFEPGYHVGIVFDDMHFNGDENGKGAWPRTSQIHLVDFDLARSIHCRYNVAMIPAGIHKIFTCNFFPFMEDSAIRRRINHIVF